MDRSYVIIVSIASIPSRRAALVRALALALALALAVAMYSVVVTVVAIVFMMFMTKARKQNRNLKLQVQDLQQKNQNLNQQVLDLQDDIKGLQHDIDVLKEINENAQQVVIDERCIHVLECLEVNDTAARRAIEQRDAESLINQLVPVLQTKEDNLFGPCTFKCIATAANSANHKVAMLATVLAHAIIMVQHAELLMGSELAEFNKRGGAVYAIATINKMLDKPHVGSTMIEIARPQCLAGCTNQMSVARRWAMAVAISIYLGDTTKFDAFSAV